MQHQSSGLAPLLVNVTCPIFRNCISDPLPPFHVWYILLQSRQIKGHTVYLLLLTRAYKLFHTEILYLPWHPVTAAVLRSVIPNTLFMSVWFRASALPHNHSAFLYTNVLQLLTNRSILFTTPCLPGRKIHFYWFYDYLSNIAGNSTRSK